MQIAIHVEPYERRTAASVRRDIEYLVKTYGAHPAFLRVPPAPIASIPVQKPQPVASEPELAALPASQRTSVLLTASELDILDRLRGMRLPNRVRLNDSDMIRAALQHLNRLTDAQIAEILARTAPLRRGRK